MSQNEFSELNRPYIPNKIADTEVDDTFTCRYKSFPQDDELSLQDKIIGNSNNFDAWRGIMYYQDEEHINQGKTILCDYPCLHIPVEKGTMSGKIYIDNEIIQTFIVTENSAVKINDLGDQGVHVTGGFLRSTGVLVLFWTSNPGAHKIKISYESGWEPSPEELWKDKTQQSTDLLTELHDTKEKLQEAQKEIANIHTAVDQVKNYMVDKLDKYLKTLLPEQVRQIMKKPTVEIFEDAMES